MASLNGVLSPASHSDPADPSIILSAKRKRDDGTELQNQINGISDSKNAAATPTPTPEDPQALITDLIDVLKAHDTNPSILKRSLPEHTSSQEPQAKRYKSEGSTEATTILTRQSSNSYSSIEEVLEDIDLAVSDITEKLQLPKGESHFVPPSPSQAETSWKITAFKKRAYELVEREKRGKKTMLDESAAKDSAAHLANGAIRSDSVADVNASSGENKLVLTLYGHAPQPKQLFSSLQLPTKANGETRNIVQPLRETGLPNGITTTQIIPIQATGLIDDRKRVPTMGDLFPTPATVPQLQPPQLSKIATTKGSTVGWYQPATAHPPPRNGSYSKQSVSTGQWLDYSKAAPSPGTKRKQRDRALSLGGSRVPQLEVDSTESEGAKLDALFRSAYSSFAPTKDDAAAVVPAGMMDRIWWEHVGEKNFGRLVQNTNNLVELGIPETDSTDQSAHGVVDETEKFREAVESFVDPHLESVPSKAADEKEVDEVLEEISDLLRTLNSHQRNRHLNLNQSGRFIGIDKSYLGTPSKPGEREISIYEILKSQLTLMIASLPPYAVAKLDSDQLAELAISSKMDISMDDNRGIMEEDEASARARAAALSAASASRPQQQAQHRPSTSTLYGSQYSAPRAAAQPQYYAQAQAAIRPPSNHLQRPPTTAQVPYPSQRPAAGAPYRPNAYGTPNYQSHRPPQSYTPQPQYQPTPSHQSYNRPPGPPYQAAPQSAPPAAMNPRYVGQPSYSQPAPAQNGMNYQYGNGIHAARQASPQKPMPSPQPAYNHAQARPAYATPTASTMPDHRPYLQNPMAQAQMMNGESTPSRQPQHAPEQQQLGPTNYSTFMTTEQQSSMMERQRAQLAQQQGLQQMARNAAQAGTMGSPSTSQINGNAVSAGL